MSSNLSIVFGKQVLQEFLKGDFSIIKNVKYHSKWKNSLQPGMNSISDELPWISFPVINFLEQHVNSTSKIFEYGGGGSTLFFVNRAGEVVTVEHDPEWFSKLTQNINKKKLTNWQGNLILPEKDNHSTELDPSEPSHYFSSDEKYIDSIFKLYATYIDRYADDYFDIVLVDGRARPSCIWHSLPKIKKGGYLIVDNSNRSYYFRAIDKMLKARFELVYNKMAPSPYSSFFTQTGVWCRR